MGGAYSAKSPSGHIKHLQERIRKTAVIRGTFKHMLLCAHSQEDKGASKRPVSCTNFAGMTPRGTPSPIHTHFVCMSQPQTSKKAIGFFSCMNKDMWHSILKMIYINAFEVEIIS